MRTVSFIFFCFVLLGSVRGATVDTVSVYSRSMDKDVEVVVVTPADRSRQYPVVYLLHGYSGDAKSWIAIRPDLPRIAEQYRLMFVCPDGDNSWYWDSPNDPASQYETFVSKELVAYIDREYPAKPSPAGRAVTGLSMGGHGALWVAFRNPGVFGAAGSTSGGVDIRPFPKNWEMSKQLGAYESNKAVWESHTVINLAGSLRSGQQAIIIDCGYDDFFFEVNNNLHGKLLEQGIAHDYLVRPGGHNNAYWSNSIAYQILFFRNYFDSNK